ncbi:MULTISPECIES: YheT family hydrolase [unclassified Halobacteriovorax]|uniref:YheT family hydrolase n=1 Tax=unclassified Halobacteriovorax TaxID=2639665 RepID=UPI000EA04C43|nr:alpha/beta fold hydrolase [Halobacteriovorax sp. BALOs_7]AYF43396.1 alpha/beta hydrolase family protein [Halobacteriovorax sp. BALOs_7]
MPVIQSEYQCHQSLKNGHIQTLIPFFIRWGKPHELLTRTLTTPDGDFLRYYVSKAENPLNHVIIISHGLEGNGRDRYIIDMKKKFTAQGYDVISWDMRSCGGKLNRTKKFYNAKDFKDLEFLIENIADDYEKVSLMGISLGGAITTNYLGRNCDNVHPKVYRAFILSSPLDLNASNKKLRTEFSRFIYRHAFVYSMRKKVIEKAKVMDLPVDLNKVRKIKHIDEFDDYVTAPLYGYRNGEDYRSQASPLAHLEKIKIPFYILNAYDDPFLSKESYPFKLAKEKENIFLEVPKHGGHVGFVKSFRDEYYWYELRILEFLKMKI